MGPTVALYARVSTERQAEQQTSEQQVARLRAYAQQRGWPLDEAHLYRDEGYSGATLNRPALDRLRDALARGEVDILLVTSPDRLARRYAYQVWLLEACERAGCTVIFLDRPPSGDPQETLLLQIRGAVAEYERSLIADRMRRGRLAKLQSGQLLPWARPPYGYRPDPQRPRDPAGVSIAEAEAAVVRQIFAWYADEGLSLRAIARRLTAGAIPSPQGHAWWNTSSVRKMLHNHAYRGTAYGNQMQAVPAQRRRPLIKPAAPGAARCSGRPRPPEEWIGVTVPALVSDDLFTRAQERLARNRDWSPRNTRSPYLLRRLVSCRRCGLAHRIWTNGRMAFYTCPGFSGDPARGHPQACHAPRLATHRLDAAVWADVCRVLTDPSILATSLRQVQQGWLADSPQADQRQALQRREAELRRQIERLVDAYAAGALSLEELQGRRPRLEAHLAAVRRDAEALQAAWERDARLEELAQQLEAFRAALARGLEDADFARRRQIVELLIERVVVDGSSIEIRYILPVGGLPEREGELRAHHPVDVRRIHIVAQRCPLLQGTVDDVGPAGAQVCGRPLASIGEGTGVGRVMEDRAHGGGARQAPERFPGLKAAGLSAGQSDGVGVQAAHHPLHAAQRPEALEHKSKGVLHLLVGVLDDATGGQADQPRRQMVAEGPLCDLAQAAGIQAQT
jgi:site-specific DNA recombinase